jgi:hypothetical protein
VGQHYFAQLDILGEFTDVSNQDDSYDDGRGFTIHFMRRNSDVGGLGLFGGAMITDQDNNPSATSERYYGGLEGQLYRERAILQQVLVQVAQLRQQEV